MTLSSASEFYTPIPPGYQKGKTKYVVIFGTVMSGLGKGVFASSLAKIFQDCGFIVAPIKLEGYLNRDSGTLNPLRHGEVFVLDDGTECDMDLGTYERMLDRNLTKDNFATNGQFLAAVLEKERRGEYLGRDVQIIPHVTGEVKLRLRELAVTTQADVVFVEVGGTVGDMENEYYIEALRELAFEEPNSCCFVALTHIALPKILNEQKSKPAQLGLKALAARGITPHIVACRASEEVTAQVLEKISLYASIPPDRVFSMHDVESISCVPDLLEASHIDQAVMDILSLPRRQWAPSNAWSNYVHNVVHPMDDMTIGITGKYTAVRDSYASILHALEHAATKHEIRIHIEWIDTEDVDGISRIKNTRGIIVPGGFGFRGIEGKIKAIEVARTKGIPFLGLCYGFQLAIVEFAHNVLGLKGANSTEIDLKTAHPVIHLREAQKTIENMGATMHRGGKDIILIADYGHLCDAYPGEGVVHYRFRHRYEFNTSYWSSFTNAGAVFSGLINGVPQVLELSKIDHPFFVATQAHAELTSRPLNPDPLFEGFIRAAKE